MWPGGRDDKAVGHHLLPKRNFNTKVNFALEEAVVAVGGEG